MKLPPEIRLMVYEYLLIPEPVETGNAHTRRMGVISLPHKDPSEEAPPTPQILVTCHQINQEAIFLLYTRNRLCLQTIDMTESELIRTDLLVEHDHNLRNGRKVKITGSSDFPASGIFYGPILRRFTTVRLTLNLKWFICIPWGNAGPAHVHLDILGGKNVGVLLKALNAHLRKANRGKGVVEICFTSTFESESARDLYRSQDARERILPMLDWLCIARDLKRMSKLRKVVYKKNKNMPKDAAKELTDWFERLNIPVEEGN